MEIEKCYSVVFVCMLLFICIAVVNSRGPYLLSKDFIFGFSAVFSLIFLVFFFGTGENHQSKYSLWELNETLCAKKWEYKHHQWTSAFDISTLLTRVKEFLTSHERKRLKYIFQTGVNNFGNFKYIAVILF